MLPNLEVLEGLGYAGFPYPRLRFSSPIPPSLQLFILSADGEKNILTVFEIRLSLPELKVT